MTPTRSSDQRKYMSRSLKRPPGKRALGPALPRLALPPRMPARLSKAAATALSRWSSRFLGASLGAAFGLGFGSSAAGEKNGSSGLGGVAGLAAFGSALRRRSSRRPTAVASPSSPAQVMDGLPSMSIRSL